METTHQVIAGFAVLILVASLMPFIRSDYWTFRIFDFPRMQKLVLSFAALTAMAIYRSDHWLYDTLTILLIVNCVYLLRIILPYTPLWRPWVKKTKKPDPSNTLSLVVSNVYQDNTDYAGCLTMLKKADPDIVLLLETDALWAENVSGLQETYPHQVLIPQENTYGMLLYSRLPLRNTEVRFQVEEDIPSIFCQAQLPSGAWIQLCCLHPTPPSPTENLRSTERDQELLITAEFVKNQRLPVIVMGDLNDVAWSYTTELFLKMSGLLDPRIGRGFYNSFNAKTWLMRFPLDHLFVSPDFRHMRISRLHPFQSDHFPIFGRYQYVPSAPADQEPLVPTAEDVETAEEKRNAT
jgi:endonuclease/exonuclease/phosphatase (EEP) superfamily protein YafD